ncbi:damage-inducible protein DinB [Paenibacillus psychroresistens]|uniref:Damage-inducible protein DinB n=1 Tax=Paenibacillus psychroresistens TaxID=1778678 RepID=A0A6B8RIQ2_9BACL|nr:DinB family protein [Paenibacillus psychroresistens]QGQ95452.1 damage-inducible protein DinB [Paenibacillus psychroresistens]
MKLLFEYNWQVRNEWFEWCSHVPNEVLIHKRIGGAGSILHTFFHIVDTELSWIRAIEGKPDIAPQFSDYNSLAQVVQFSKDSNEEIKDFILSWSTELERKTVMPSWMENESFTAGEILRHIIAHEIHHIGQLSIWSRELELKPVSSNFIGRGL